MNALDLINRHLAAPKKFKVVTLYADGSAKNHETATLVQADNYAFGERRKIGRSLISRETDASVEVVDVYVTEL